MQVVAEKIVTLLDKRIALCDTGITTKGAHMQTRPQTAAIIADALEASGRVDRAKVWQRDDHIRIYCSRRLSRRTQDMGYVEILDDGTVSTGGMTRAVASIRDIAAAAMVAA